MNTKTYESIQHLMRVLEGEYSFDEGGGKTYWGITEKHQRTSFEQLFNTWPPTRETATMFYSTWWTRNELDLLPPGSASVWFWFSVHIGEPRARKVLQSAINTTLRIQAEQGFTTAPYLALDGVIGPKTRRAMLRMNESPEVFALKLRFEIVRWYKAYLPDFPYQNRLI